MPQANQAPLPPIERIGRLTTDQYFRMIDAGIIRAGAPYELLDGLLVLKDRSTHGEDLMSIGEPHSLTVGILSDLNYSLNGRGCFMRSQCPIRIPPFHAPEPDGAIVRGARTDYYKEAPLFSDVSSIIEVADSSLVFDRTDKAPKYAEAGIPQFVLIDLTNNLIEVYEKPDAGQRFYAECRVAKPGDEVHFLLPDSTRLGVAVTKLIPYC